VRVLAISGSLRARSCKRALLDAAASLALSGMEWEKPVLLLNASAAGGSFAQAALAETLRTMSLHVLEGSLTTPFLPRKLQQGTALDPGAASKLRDALEALAGAIRRPRSQ
jgi:NAD(P)H-dependent FMN reductase